MARPRPATKKEVVQAFRTREILAAARRVMDQRGLEALTMEEIAATAGVAKGTVYLYFQGKEDLIRALVSQVAENLLRDLQAITARPLLPQEKLTQVITLLLKNLEGERALFPVYVRDLMSRPRRVPSGRTRQLWALEEEIMALVTRLFGEGMAAGQFMAANPRLLTFLLRGLVRAVGFYQLVEGKENAVQEALPVLLTLLSSGVARPAPFQGEVAAT
jgi:AcrR family transcriptional regulator